MQTGHEMQQTFCFQIKFIKRMKLSKANNLIIFVTVPDLEISRAILTTFLAF